MHFLKAISIKKKLAILTLVTVLSSICFVAASDIAYERLVYKKQFVQDIGSIASFIEKFSRDALAVSDKKKIHALLEWVQLNRDHIESVAIYGRSDSLLADVSNVNRAVAPLLLKPFPSQKFTDLSGIFSFPIVSRNGKDLLGTIIIEARMESSDKRVGEHVNLFLLMMPVAVVIAYFLSSHLRRGIARPIEHIAAIAKQVSVNKDYNIRAEKLATNEIGTLIDGFNEMLGQIQKRDRELQIARDGLELRVQERVEELSQEIAERKKLEVAQKELQGRLERSQRLESLGILAGGVAHDLNNILGPIVAYPELILIDLPSESPVREDIEAIRDASRKAAAVIQDLLTLARRGSYSKSVIDLNKIVKSYLESHGFTRKLSLHRHVSIRTKLSKGSLPFLGSDSHLTQVVMNLVINALEAVPQKGAILIATRRIKSLTPAEGYNGPIPPNEYVVLSIADSGQGISRQDIAHIFEPFFTRKKMGQSSGTGLGLAVVYGIIADLGGHIKLKSKKGEGTVFNVYFPAVPFERAAKPPEAELLKGTESILVVDDDIRQRALAKKLLTRLGYKVTTAESGVEAIRLVRKADFDLIVLDMIMEDEFDGLDIYKAILDIRPDQRVIIASGFAESERAKEARSLGCGICLRKPYTLQEIGLAARSAMEVPSKV